ncbi:MAG: TraB/GumN family protein [Paracoccaceae bacterium]
MSDAPYRRSAWPERARWTLGRLAALAVAGAVALATAPHAPAAELLCEGEDLIARLAETDPAAHAALLAEAEAVENGGRRLWRIEPEAGGAPSHLFGTYHDTEADDTLTPAVDAAFETAERLVVELTTAEVARMEKRARTDPGFVMRPEPLDGVDTLSERLSPEERVAAEAVLAERGLNLAVAERLRPWMLFSTLGVPACQMRALAAGESVLDQVLVERAEARGLPVTGLETYEAALGAFDALDDEATRRLAVDALLLAAIEEDVRATLLGAYAEGEVGLLAAFGDRLARTRTAQTSEEGARLAEAFAERLLVGRNRAWMDPLEAALADGGAFVAVGALHLPGEDGLVALLRERGYAVEPVAEGF